MDILIKGMEMPSEGRIINLTICSDGSVINNLPDAGGKMSSYRSERVKAVALPEHHGRLGDLDELSNKLTGKGITRLLLSKKSYITVGDVKTIIDNAPTIVEATE